MNGKEYNFVESLVLNSQTSTTVIAVARIPVPFVPLGFLLTTDTSLGSSTVALGNAANGNSAIYKAAGTFTATDTPTMFGKAAVLGVPVLTGVDCLTGATTGYNTPGQGGTGYEDVCLTVGVASLPASGNLRIVTKYLLPS